MSRLVWKYKLQINSTGAAAESTVTMPEDAEIVYVGMLPTYGAGSMRDTEPYIWVDCDPEAKLHDRTYWVVGTGRDIPNLAGAHIGTALDTKHLELWHVFEESSF